MDIPAGPAREPREQDVDVDVLIIGAGISGIGSACHLRRNCPWARFAIVEAKHSFGGTWLTHRYPGIRSDTDLYTYGYGFKPWTGPAIASSAEILAYMNEVIEDHGLAPHIRYGHRITAASWSSATNAWTIEATRSDTRETIRLTARFLWMCQGYYRHDAGYTPDWDGLSSFQGRIVHPQTWPDELDVSGKQVVVVGSGSTAATIVPALAAARARVTMLQRSPTYFATTRRNSTLVAELRELGIDETWIHEIARRKTIAETAKFNRRCAIEPDAVARDLLGGVRALLGPDYDIATHFTPRYKPWQQRLAFVPDADFFQAIASGQARVVTDEIERFTPSGIALRSGADLAADIVVTATGFDLSLLGDMDVTIDDRPLVLGDTITYRGTMFTGVPNCAWVFGYLRAGWTLRSDLVGGFVCRLLEHMRATGAKRVTPALRPSQRDMMLTPYIDPGDFSAGYVRRGLDRLPRSGDQPEWRNAQDYLVEQAEFAAVDFTDPVFVYG